MQRGRVQTHYRGRRHCGELLRFRAAALLQKMRWEQQTHTHLNRKTRVLKYCILDVTGVNLGVVRLLVVWWTRLLCQPAGGPKSETAPGFMNGMLGKLRVRQCLCIHLNSEKIATACVYSSYSRLSERLFAVSQEGARCAEQLTLLWEATYCSPAIDPPRITASLCWEQITPQDYWVLSDGFQRETFFKISLWS